MTPQELKNSILQLAIQGKLVEQRPEEGTAEELYRQIQQEKQALIKAGKIKKEKPIPEITEDEIPFEIPESWKWVRLSSISYKIFAGGDKPKDFSTKCDDKHMFPVIGNGIVNDGILGYSATYTADENTITVAGRGTIGFSLYRKYKYCPVIRLIVIQQANYIDPIYLQNVLSALPEKSLGTSIPQLTVPMLSPKLIPLPPLAEQKRIVAKIKELLPYIDRYEKAWNRLEDFNKRFPADMQKSILQLAIQGKLVEQRPEEGAGEALYQQIQKEKQNLIKAGKIKKEKPLPEIAEDETPFDIPNGWQWMRLSDLSETIGDGIHGTPLFNVDGDYYFVNGNNLNNGNIVFKNDTQRVTEAEYQKYKKPLKDTTILLSINGTIGNIAYYNSEPIILGKSACYITLLHGLYRPYLRILLESKFFMDYAFREATQTTIKNVSLKAIRMFPIPLPPLAEQKRIVAKLEELLPLCERLK